MKRNQVVWTVAFLFLFLWMFTSVAFAYGYGRAKSTTFKIGYYNPKDAKGGLMLGINMSGSADEMVDLGFSLDVFHRSYQKDSEVAKSVSSGGVVERQMQRNLDFSTTAIPLMGTITVKFSSTMPFTYFMTGGLGYALMWNKETNYDLDVSDKRFYHGFTWRVGGGAMYRLGSRSYLLGEVFYNDAHLKRNQGETPNGLPVWTEVNMSGLGFCIGIRVGGY